MGDTTPFVGSDAIAKKKAPNTMSAVNIRGTKVAFDCSDDP